MGLLRKIFGSGEGKSEGADDEAEGSGIRECLELQTPSPSDADLRDAPGAAEATRRPRNAAPSGSREKTARVVGPTGSGSKELRNAASGRRSRSAAALGVGAALDDLAAPEVSSTSTSSTPPMSTDADHDVSDVDETTLSEASEEFDLSEEELDAWEDLITSDEVATEGQSPALSRRGSIRGSGGVQKVGPHKELDVALHLLADFAVRVLIGPLAVEWVTEVQRAATILLSARPESQDPTGSALLSRLVWLVDSGSREELLDLVSALPAGVPGWPEWASDLGGEARRRERRILHELFRARDGFEAEQRQRLEQEMSLEQLRVAGPDALAVAFDTPLERARELWDVVEAYSIERQARPPDAASSAAPRAGELSGFPVGSATFWSALEDLERHCQKFADCDEDDSGELKVMRQRRRDALMRVNLILAENGEIELLDMLVPCAVTECIRRLRSWFGVDAEGQD